MKWRRQSCTSRETFKVEDNTSCLPHGGSMWTEHPATPPGWVMEGHEHTELHDWLTEAPSRAHVVTALSRQGNGDGAVCPTARVDAGLCELLAMFLRLLVCDGGQETHRDRIPLLRQQQEQEAQADDAGGCQAHHAEDHLVFQEIYGCSGWTKTRGGSPREKGGCEDGRERQKQIEINYIK